MDLLNFLSICLSTGNPSMPDWITAVSALLGIPTAIFGFFKLFKKNKELESSILSLSSIAKSQQESISLMREELSQLTKQTVEFQYQSSLMKEANELLTRRIEIEKAKKEQDEKNQKELKELAQLERLNNIKPNFYLEGGQMSNDITNSIAFRLTNKGFLAKNISISVSSDQFVTLEPLSEENIDQNQSFFVRGWVDPNKTYFTASQVNYQFELDFCDEDNNRYKQVISRKNQNLKITLPEITFKS